MLAEEKVPDRPPAKCAKYDGWGCFIIVGVIIIVALFLLIGLGGPLYNDCGTNDCASQIHYGLYCNDHCLYGHVGPGNSRVLLLVVGLLAICLAPWCWPVGAVERAPERIYKDGHAYERVDDRIIF